MSVKRESTVLPLVCFVVVARVPGAWSLTLFLGLISTPMCCYIYLLLLLLPLVCFVVVARVAGAWSLTFCSVGLMPGLQ